MRTLFLAIAALAVTATAAFADAPVTTVKTQKGDVLAGKNGMTLYTYKNDSKGTSTCYEACASNWPPFKAQASAKVGGAFTVIDRKDGTKQWAKDGMPLYYFVKDKKQGDVSGDGVKGVWDAARP